LPVRLSMTVRVLFDTRGSWEKAWER